MKHFVYKHWDKDGVLLYVGCCKDVGKRTLNHSSNAHWFDRISKITSEEFPTRKAGLKAEKKAIKKERPLFNIAQHPDRLLRSMALIEPPESPDGLLGKEGVRYKLYKFCCDAGGIEYAAKKLRWPMTSIYAALRKEKIPPGKVLGNLGIEEIYVPIRPKADPMDNVCYN